MEKSEAKFQFDGPASAHSGLPTWITISIMNGGVQKVFCDEGNNVAEHTYPYRSATADEIREALAPALKSADYDDVMRALKMLDDAELAYSDALRQFGGATREEDFPLIDLPSLAAAIRGTN